MNDDAADAPITPPEEDIVDLGAESPEETEELSAVWDKLQGGEAEAEPVEIVDRDEKGRFKAREAQDKVEGSEPVDPPAPEPAERPAIYSALPRAVRDNWDSLPEDVRDAVAQSHDQMAKKAMEAGRLMKGLGPIQHVLREASQEFPELANLTPDQVAADTMELARTRVQLLRDPVNTLLAVAQQVGALDALRAAITGQGQGQGQRPPQQQMQPQPQRQPVQQQMNPDIIRGTVDQIMDQRLVLDQVQNWAASKEHYALLEPRLPEFIERVQQSAEPGASNVDILDAAYDMAVRQFGLRASQPPVAEAMDPAAPQRTEAALKAKSVNVKSRGTRETPLTDEQALGAAWERAMRA